MWWIAVIIVVVIIFIYFLQKYYDREAYLFGFWGAQDDEFCREGNIKSMMLFIDEVGPGWFTLERNCCLVIVTDDIYVGNFVMSYGRFSPGCVTVKFEDDPIWPDRLKMDVNISTGLLKIYNDENIFAILTKNHVITNMI